MSKSDIFTEFASVRGNTTVPVMVQPFIRGTIHRHDPDGGHAQPYFPGLAGTSLNVQIDNINVPGAIAITINFVTNNYADAVAAVNAANPNIAWRESDGFACIQNQNGGDKNWIKITGGTAAAPLGLPISPYPGSYAQAGDPLPSGTSKLQANQQVSELLGHDENLSSASINRAIYGSLLGVFDRLGSLDKEFTVHKLIPAIQYSSGGAVPTNTATLSDVPNYGQYRVSANALANALVPEKVIGVLTNDAYPVPLYDPTTGVLVKVLGVSYGPSDTASETNQTLTWGTPPANPGASLKGSNLYGSFKRSAINITSIDGAVIKATGALFLTNKVQANDHILITGASNNTPFNHNGEFVILQVLDEDQIVVRAMGNSEQSYTQAANIDKPLALNPDLGVGSYGQVAVFVGLNVRLGGKTGAGHDLIFFRLSSNLTVGQNINLLVPVVTTLRRALSEAFLPNAAFDQDPQIARQNKANIFQFIQEFQKGIQLDEIDSFGTTARVLAPAHSQTAGYNLMWSTEGVDQGGGNRITTRLYATTFAGNLAGFVFTTNARLDNAGNWNKDITGVAAYRFLFFSGVLNIQGRLAGSNAAWTDGAGWNAASSLKFDIVANLLTLLSNLTMTGDANITGNATVSATVDVGSGLRNTGTGVASGPQARTARLQSTLPGSVSDDAAFGRVLINDWITPTKAHYRIYTSRGAGYRDFHITVNANWGGPAFGWTSDDATEASYSFRLGTHFKLEYKAATGASWAEGTWDSIPLDLDMSTGRIVTSLGLDSFVDMVEIADPAAPAATHGRFYLRSNGLVTPNHRTQLVVQWSDGTIYVITESAAS